MSLPLNNRVAIITGASRGIGRAIALHLASLGASVAIIFSSNSAEADRLVAEINSSSSSSTRRAIPIRADVSDPDAVRSAFDLAEQTFDSPPHIVVHSAGINSSTYPPIASTPIAEFDSIMSVNARGAFLVLQQAANRVVRGGGGRIVAVSSTLVATNRPGYGAYTASKAAVDAMVRVLAKELSGTKVTVNCVSPGPVATELFYAGKTEEDVKRAAESAYLGRLGTPEDIGPLVGFLCRDEGEWVNGQVIRANGGMI